MGSEQDNSGDGGVVARQRLRRGDRWEKRRSVDVAIVVDVMMSILMQIWWWSSQDRVDFLWVLSALSRGGDIDRGKMGEMEVVDPISDGDGVGDGQW